MVKKYELQNIDMRYQNKLIKLDTKLVKTIFAVGDIHGEFLTFADDLVNSCKVKNCCVIVCGDIGLGFYSRDKMKEFFQRTMTTILIRFCFGVVQSVLTEQ